MSKQTKRVCLIFLMAGSLMLQGCKSGKSSMTETGEAGSFQKTETVSEKPVEAGNTLSDSPDGADEEKTREDIRQVLTAQKEERIRQLFLDKMLLEEAVRTLVADRLGSTSFVKVNPREKYNITEVLIDEVTGNPIVAEGVKSMLDAVAEEKPVSEIIKETVQGAGSGVSDYLTGELEGAITDALGVDVFSAIDFMNAWNHADSTPTVLLQKIVDGQKQDVAKLDLFLQQENVNAADILELSQLMYCIHIREQEISTITGEAAKDSSSDYVQLRRISSRYAQLDKEIEFLGGLDFTGSIEEMASDDINQLQELQKELVNITEEAAQLTELSVGNIAVNYDVSGFMKAQESTSQSGMFGDVFLGDVLGGMAAEDIQTIEDQVQEKRAVLYNKLSDYMEESFRALTEAKTDFDGFIAFMNQIGKAEESELYFVRQYLESTDWKTEYENTRQNYVAALERYLFDLSCATQFYQCVLTAEQSAFLSALVEEQEAIRSCIAVWDAETTLGYTGEEQNERYQELVTLYVEMVDYIQVRGASLGQTPGFHSGSRITKYGEGVYYSYVNGDKITVVIRLRDTEYIYDGNGVRNYYDMQGNPIYTCAGQDWVSFFNNEVMAYELMNDEFVSYYQEKAVKALAVFNGG